MNYELAELFRRLTCGVYVIGVTDGTHHNAFTAAWIMQVSFDPLLVAMSINPQHTSYSLLEKGGVFSVNVLRRDQIELARHFGTQSGSQTDKLKDVNWHTGLSGVPLLDETMACMECRVVSTMLAGDHQLVLAQVTDGELFDDQAVPLTYAETDDMDGSSLLYNDFV